MHLLPGPSFRVAQSVSFACELSEGSGPFASTAIGKTKGISPLIALPGPASNSAPQGESPRSNPRFTPVWATADEPHLANTWERFSPKARRNVRIAGDLRYFLFLAIEGTPDVDELCEEPFSFRVEIDGHRVTAKYDLWCRAADGQEYYFDTFFLNKLKTVEVGSTFWRQLRARELWAAAHALRYAICTDKMLLRYPQEVANWGSILSFLSAAREIRTDDLRLRVRRCVEARRSTTVGEIAASFPDVYREDVETAVYAELHAGHLVADLRKSLLTQNILVRTA